MTKVPFACVAVALAIGACRESRPTLASYTVVTHASGASRLYATTGERSLVAEHRDWLQEAYHGRADEVPGVLKLIGPDGAVKHVVSGWALGGPVGTGDEAWVEETNEEYRYRLGRISGPGPALEPPDDFWTVAATVGHPTASAGAAVLWRPARGTTDRDPKLRRDELWIASIDRATGTVVHTRELALTLPLERHQGVVIGGPTASPILLLIGLPDPGGPGSYRLVGLRLPTLEVAWDVTLDVATAEAERPVGSRPTDRAQVPEPIAIAFDGGALRTSYSVMTAALGDGSGWLLAHGGRVGGILGTFATDLSFLIGDDGRVTTLYGIHVPGCTGLAPILGEPQVLRIGGRSIDAISPGARRTSPLADARTPVRGSASDPNQLLATSAAMRDGILFVAPPIGGNGVGADEDDVRGLPTMPPDWHRDDRPRVRARAQWLEDRRRP